MTFIVHPNVFSPKYFRDTEIFAHHLPIRPGDEMLEIGPGTGAISVMAVYRGARRVVAVDINPDAVRNARENARLHGMSGPIEVRHGDLYDPLSRDERFDLIFWNTPFGLVGDGVWTNLERAVYDPGYRATERFIKEGKRYLKTGGRLYIGFSSTLGRLDLLRRFAHEAGLRLRLIHEAGSQELHPVKFEVFEAGL
ncbi:MAG: methyltransferase [bacterium]|nr:methyltransferase [bacterium]MDZ4296522.1 methyltransferase [Patescibacteria group bacterium]